MDARCTMVMGFDSYETAKAYAEKMANATLKWKELPPTMIGEVEVFAKMFEAEHAGAKYKVDKSARQGTPPFDLRAWHPADIGSIHVVAAPEHEKKSIRNRGKNGRKN